MQDGSRIPEELRRSLRPIDLRERGRVRIGRREYVDFSSNDYLGLAADGRLGRAAADAAVRFGSGAGASRLISGSQQIHALLEQKIAAFKGVEAALVFSSGYAAGVGAIQGLFSKSDLIVADRLAHASLIDGIRLSGAELKIFRHNDAGSLDHALRRYGKKRDVLIVTEGVFSMDGDLAPLREIVEVKRRSGAVLMVDDAHGTGVLGATGRGICEETGIEPGLIDIAMGTLSKAVGAQGGFVAGARRTIETLVNRSRSFVYSTALAPPVAAAALEGLRIIEAYPTLIGTLRENVGFFRANLCDGCCVMGDPRSAIVPIMIGDSRKAVEIGNEIMARGFLVGVVRPPTVPSGSARLRVTISAVHVKDDLCRLAEVLNEILTVR